MKILNHNKRVFSVLLLVLGICFVQVLKAEDVELIKRYQKAYKVSSNAQIDLINKYGDIIVRTWDKDSAVFKIKITAYGSSDEAVKKLIDRVEFEGSNSGQFLKFESVFDRSSGSFKEFWNSLGDYSKVLINKKNLNIDFEIFLPKQSSLYLENKFGDVFINEFYGRCKLNISQGDLKISELKGPLDLELKFGNANIQAVNSGNFKMQIAELTLGSGKNITCNSSSSTIRIGDVRSLKIDSRNDKYFLKNVYSMNGDATFTDLIITNLTSEFINKSNFGDLTIETVEESLKLINIEGRSTDISIWVPGQLSIDVDIKAREDKLKLPLEWSSLSSYYVDDKNKYVRKSGLINAGKPAQIHIDNQGGSLNIFKK